jgi:SAM-dependent methyltransferase
MNCGNSGLNIKKGKRIKGVKIKEEKTCRVCGQELKVILDLGNIVPSGFVDHDNSQGDDAKAPLILAECVACKLVQLKHTVDLDLMYRQYWYASSLNKSMVSSLSDIVVDIEKRLLLEPGDIVLDIGCNDGTLLGMYPDYLHRIGFDPAENLNIPDYVKLVNDYFSYDRWSYTFQPTSFAKVITAIAMFYDLPDPHGFVEDVADVLADTGLFVIQFTDLLSMYKACAFDNICHEHLEYYKLADVKFLLEAHGLEIIDVSYNTVNGGSVRITAAHAGVYPVSEFVEKALNYENIYMRDLGFPVFKENMDIAITDMFGFLAFTKVFDKEVFLLGASTKGNTLLQVCKIDRAKVPFAAEVNKDKFGLYTAGTGIYILPEDEAFDLKPDYFIVPIWHFKESILNNPKVIKYIDDGGALVFPLPEFELVRKENLDDQRKTKDNR